MYRTFDVIVVRFEQLLCALFTVFCFDREIKCIEKERSLNLQ